MAGSDHSITSQKITLHVPDETMALALQPALAGINERLLLPVIEQVFDEFDRPGSEILIERLAVDLGAIPLDQFAALAPGRLLDALRAELARLLAGMAPDSDPGTTVLNADAAEIAALEHYLLSGLWPNWSPRPGAFDLDGIMLGIADARPAELGAMLYRIGRDRAVLERLVAQFDAATLARLVEVLEPQHAALIVGTIAESRLAHKAQPVLDMSEDAFADRVWLMTMNYLLAEPGTQFNRREFVKSLLRGMAEQAGAQYGDVLSTLRRALRQVARRRPLRSSLPAILLELAREEGREIGAAGIFHAGRTGEADAGDFRAARVLPSRGAQEAGEGRAGDTHSPSGVRASVGAPRATVDAVAGEARWPHGPHDRKQGPPMAGHRLEREPADFHRPLPDWAGHDDADVSLAEVAREWGERPAMDASPLSSSPPWPPSWPADPAMQRFIAAIAGGGATAARALRQAYAQHDWDDVARNFTHLPGQQGRSSQDFAVQPETDISGMAALLADASAVFRRYDSGEALACLIRAGVTDGEEARRAAGMSRLEIVSALLELPAPAVRAAMTRAFAAGKRRQMQRFLTGVPEREIVRLLRALLPTAMVPGMPFFESVQGRAAEVVDRPAFYAGLMTAILKGESIALDELAKRAAAGARIATAKQRFDRRADNAAVLAALHALLQALPRQLRPSDEQLAVLLRMQSDVSLQQAVDAEFVVRLMRQNLAAPLTAAAVEALREILQGVSPATALSPRAGAVLRDAIERVAGDIEPDRVAAGRTENAAVLAALHALLQALPRQLRPSDEQLAVLLRMQSDVSLQQAVDAEFVVRLMRQNLAAPLTAAAVEALRESLRRVGPATALSPRVRALLRDAIERIAGDIEPDSVAAGRADNAAVLAALHALLQALPRQLRPRHEQLAAILRMQSDVSLQQAIDAEFIVRLMRQNLAAPLTAAAVEALRESLQGVSSATALSPRVRAVLRDAIERIAGETEPDAVAAGRTENAAVLAVLHALLQALPREFNRGEDHIAVFLPMASDASRQERPIDAEFIAGLIRENIIRPLTAPALEALRRSLDDLGHAADIAPRSRALLRAAIERIGKETERRSAPRRRASKAEKARIAARNMAADFLASGRRANKGRGSITDSALAAAAIDLIAREPVRAAAAARAGLRRRRTLAAWRCRLPESALARLVALLEPKRHRLLLELAESLGAVLQEQLAEAGKPAFGRRNFWNFVLGFVATAAGKSWSVREAVETFTRDEVAPRLGRVAVFEDMMQAVANEAQPTSAAALAAASTPRDAAPDHTEQAVALLPELLQADAPEGRQKARAILLDSLTGRVRREAVSGALSERQFATALALLEPHRHKTLLETGTLLFAALAATDRRAAALFGGAQPPQKFLLDFVARYRGRSWSAETMVEEFFRHVAAGYSESLGQESESAAFLQSLLAAIGARAKTAGMSGMAQTLHRLSPAIMRRAWPRGAEGRSPLIPSAQAPTLPVKPRPAARPYRPEASRERPGRSPIYVDNAGLVLAAPFIPHLFRELGMLEKTAAGALLLSEPATATRAVHLLQYLVTSQTATPEPLLALNKLLAGVPIAAVVGARIEATERELALCGKVLASMLANWPALSTGTSPVGLQNTFLQREGRLTYDGDKWLLKVERKTLDVLVDRVPWSFRLIFHSWMPRPLHVEW